MTDGALDAARQAALEEAKRSERRARGFLIGAGITEAVLFVAILAVIDFNETTHLLIFLCACLVYAPIAFGMFALRYHLDMSTQRVLLGIQYGRGDS